MHLSRVFVYDHSATALQKQKACNTFWALQAFITNIYHKLFLFLNRCLRLCGGIESFDNRCSSGRRCGHLAVRLRKAVKLLGHLEILNYFLP